jgi:phage pi2 protein 07
LNINSFYKKQLPYHEEEFENLSKLKEKVQLAYHTLINPEKRKEYDLEVFGILYYDYPADEIADENFKLKAVELIEDFLREEFLECHEY